MKTETQQIIHRADALARELFALETWEQYYHMAKTALLNAIPSGDYGFSWIEDTLREWAKDGVERMHAPEPGDADPVTGWRWPEWLLALSGNGGEGVVVCKMFPWGLTASRDAVAAFEALRRLYGHQCVLTDAEIKRIGRHDGRPSQYDGLLAAAEADERGEATDVAGVMKPVTPMKFAGYWVHVSCSGRSAFVMGMADRADFVAWWHSLDGAEEWEAAVQEILA